MPSAFANNDVIFGKSAYRLPIYMMPTLALGVKLRQRKPISVEITSASSPPPGVVPEPTRQIPQTGTRGAVVQRRRRRCRRRRPDDGGAAQEKRRRAGPAQKRRRLPPER